MSNKLPKQQQQTNPQKQTDSGLHVKHETYYKGIIPPPEMLEHYEQIIPGFSREYLDMVKENQSYSRKSDRKYLNSFISTIWMGHISALLVAGGIGYLSYVCITSGYPGFGTTLIVSGAVLIVGRFLRANFFNKK